MALTHLELNHFRNFNQASIQFSDRLTLIVGRNGQGKTNLLESVYLLLQGRDFRTTVEREAIQKDQVTALLNGMGTIGDQVERWKHIIPATGRRSHTGKTIPLVLFSPEDVYLAKGSPDKRRQFLDLLLAAHDPRYARSLRTYHRIVLQRNRALKEASLNRVVDDFTPLLIREGSYIWRRRRETLLTLTPDAREIQHRLSSQELLDIRLQYGGSKNPILTDEDYMAHLMQRRHEETMRQTTLVGPHRDDLIVTLDGLNTRQYASQGQLRTVALSLKLGCHAWLFRETGIRPIILLDDVLSELDATRRQAVLESVSQSGQQTIVTDTEPRSYAALQPHILHVDHGEVNYG